MPLSKKRSIQFIILIGFILLCVFAIRWIFFSQADTPTYLTEKVKRGNIEDVVMANGTIKALQQVSVGAQASGQIKTLHVALGDFVKQGQLIAEIDSLTQKNALRSAQAELTVLKAQLQAKQALLKQAQAAYQRQKLMRSKEASTQAELEAAQATLATAHAEILVLQAQIDKATISVDTARLNLGYTQITAPMDGIVVALVALQGQTVNANQNAPTIIKLAYIDIMTVKAQISEADITRVHPGQKVYFTILGAPEKRYHTTLRAIEPAPDSILQDDTEATASTNAAIYYNGMLDIPNKDHHLRISMTAQVNIILSEAKNALLIPAVALGPREADGRYTVQVIEADNPDKKRKATSLPVKRKVKIGINTNINAQVLDGLKEGETVVLNHLDSTDTSGRRPKMRVL